MARGAEAKLRRRNRKKADAETVIDMFGTGDNLVSTPVSGPVIDDDEDDDEDDHDDEEEKIDDILPKRKKKASNMETSDPPILGSNSASGKKQIKSTPLILLVLMIGTTLLPALIYASDSIASILSKNNIMGSIGFQLGIGAVPKKRVLSFYEKHAPEKLEDVPNILSKHYGDYPKLIKKLERKYQDYGYFVGWEDDEAPVRIAMEQLQTTYDVWVQQYWNKYAPQLLKTAFRNVRYNLTFLLKKFRKVWKKHLWPWLEPVFGVPDGAEAQKRKDAAEARRRAAQKSSSSGGGRRKNTGYRDDVDEEH